MSRTSSVHGRRPRIVYAITHPAGADLLMRGQLAFMREHGLEVTVVASPGPELDRVRDREGVSVAPLPMAREPSLRADAKGLIAMTRLLRRLRPDIVNAGTPKAGLLGMMAARAIGVPIRIYLLRGFRLETAEGMLRQVLATTERITCACAHDVVCVSPSLLRTATEGGYIPRDKALVLGAGSSNGVDADRFHRDDALRVEGALRLAQVGVRESDRVIGFVGRLAVDKGISELLAAFERVRAELPNTKLVLIGGGLAGAEIAGDLAERVRRAPGVIACDAVADLAPYYARMDVLAFPSYREGFPNVPLEAACAELPVVGFRSTGTIDVVVSGETGELVERPDVPGLASAMLRYLRDPALAAAHGRAARERAVRCFGRRAVWEQWLAFYRERLEARGLPLPRDLG